MLNKNCTTKYFWQFFTAKIFLAKIPDPLPNFLAFHFFSHYMMESNKTKTFIDILGKDKYYQKYSI